MLLYLVAVVFCLLQSAQGKNYVTSTADICAGARYELGCGEGNGPNVMKLSQVILKLDENTQAFKCDKGGICGLTMRETSQDITAQPLLNLYKSIQHNCQGKSKCEGTLPSYSQVKVQLAEGSHGGVCGYAKNEYLSALRIFMKCVGAGTVAALPPYEYPTVAVTAPATTAAPEDPTTTRAPVTIAILKSTDKVPDNTSTDKGGEEPTRTGAITRLKGITIGFIALGVVAGVAAIVGLVITIYVLYTRRGGGAVTKTSVSEHPLQDKEKGELPLDDKQPMYM